ncbi:extracellular catalytic domain type 1 short-chain-length polyhydroxyalkanoate depolymerase [Sinorhizobium alkalisoli]|uniref:extracellular catalytic domain type 1 short-chain-length polyhydroxyalkanoate depolymerase n=1 Tax=Sinorhizobium alkalisoli TaxID=1752398 RepID=UPI0009F30333|nr:PHB depolymerase family esterase [Sinorhizobium alkalisoli]
MRSLSDTVKRLSRRRHASEFTETIPTPLRPLERFGSNPGELQGWWYTPGSIAPSPALVVVLHGCTQTAAVYDACSGWSRLADDCGFALLLPEQVRSNNSNLCFNWFNPADVIRDSGEALSIRQMVEHMIERCNVDRSRVFITGLSAGGAMANVMLAAYPDVFAAGAILAGLPYMAASTIPEAFDRMRGYGLPGTDALQAKIRGVFDHQGPWPRISVWHGTKDDTVVPANAMAIVEQWRGVHGSGRHPSSTKRRGSRTLQIWKNASGRRVIELHTLSGMAHGAPLDPAGGYGRSGAFFLDVGVSSTVETARAWGLGGSKLPTYSVDGIRAAAASALRWTGLIPRPRS